MLPTVDFVIRHVGALYLPLITYTNEVTGATGELYRGEFKESPEEALGRAKHIWETDGTPNIREFKQSLLSA